MPEQITACLKCGCTNFFLHEWYVWDADIDEDSGALVAHRPSSEIECVACQECAEEYDPSLFPEITFC
jgi:hypothetical protein